jgi:hypothetical protein
VLNIQLTAECGKYLTWLEEGLNEADVAQLVTKYKTINELMISSEEEIIATKPKIGEMIVEFLRQDFHVE